MKCTILQIIEPNIILNLFRVGHLGSSKNFEKYLELSYGNVQNLRPGEGLREIFIQKRHNENLVPSTVQCSVRLTWPPFRDIEN